MLDNLLDMNFKFSVHFLWIHTSFAGHLLDDVNNLSKYFWLAFLHESHQIFNFLFFRLVDDHFVSIIHVSVKLFSQLAMIEESVVDLDEAVVLIFSLFVLP